MKFTRSSGIILHPTSLPGPDGIGDLGPAAYSWVNFLKESGCRLWQILPLGPTGYGDSPYQSFSAFAGNPYLISPAMLLDDDLITSEDLLDRPDFPEGRVNYGDAIYWKVTLLDRAYLRFKESASKELRNEMEIFQKEEAIWLEDFALFMAIKESLGMVSWENWPAALRSHDPKTLQAFQQTHFDDVEKHIFRQFLFFRQWNLLHQYTQEQGISIIGDTPIFVAYDSADVWANPDMFFMDSEGKPTFVAGVPPDYFSPTGQLWGNPIYRWEEMARCGYGWWIDRFRSALMLHDLVRIDHFRGFEACWEVPADEKTAERGAWVKGPGEAVFHAFRREFGELPVVAEDLGVITPEVERLRDKFSFPGMKILQGASNPYVPHNHVRNCIVYTGTHDNNTTRGWFAHDASAAEKQSLFRYLGRTIEEDRANEELIRLAMMSVCDAAIIPMQDHLGLGGDARMNLPAVAFGNWAWRLEAESLTPALAASILEVTETYGRTPGEGMTDSDTQPSGTHYSETV